MGEARKNTRWLLRCIQKAAWSQGLLGPGQRVRSSNAEADSGEGNQVEGPHWDSPGTGGIRPSLFNLYLSLSFHEPVGSVPSQTSA